jgi:hypothetical protein
MSFTENRNKIIGVIVGAIVFAVTSFAVSDFFSKKPTLDKALMLAASELNKTCPIMVDAETRLDNAMALPNNRFQYNYTLINRSAEELDTVQIHKSVDTQIINNVKTNPDLKIYRENNVTMAYYYKDKNGKYLMKLNVTPELYK